VLLLLSQAYRSQWGGAVLLLAISMFISCAHSLVGGAASMDFGGKKAVATAAGLFDGAQYLAASIVGWGMGLALDAFKEKALPGAEYAVWPLLPLPFAILGAILIAQLWDVVPGRKLDDAELIRIEEAGRRRMWLVERITLSLFGLVGGAYAVLALVIPQKLSKELLGHALPPGGVLLHQIMAGALLGLAIIALVAARMPKPSRTLVRAVAFGLAGASIGPLFAAITQSVPWPELRAYGVLVGMNGFCAAILAITQLARRVR
jgi:hypothetical protein